MGRSGPRWALLLAVALSIICRCSSAVVPVDGCTASGTLTMTLNQVFWWFCTTSGPTWIASTTAGTPSISGSTNSVWNVTIVNSGNYSKGTPMPLENGVVMGPHGGAWNDPQYLPTADTWYLGVTCLTALNCTLSYEFTMTATTGPAGCAYDLQSLEVSAGALGVSVGCTIPSGYVTVAVSDLNSAEVYKVSVLDSVNFAKGSAGTCLNVCNKGYSGTTSYNNITSFSKPDTYWVVVSALQCSGICTGITISVSFVPGTAPPVTSPPPTLPSSAAPSTVPPVTSTPAQPSPDPSAIPPISAPPSITPTPTLSPVAPAGGAATTGGGSSSTASSGLPVWAYILIGATGLLVAAAVVFGLVYFFVIRKKSTSSARKASESYEIMLN